MVAALRAMEGYASEVFYVGDKPSAWREIFRKVVGGRFDVLSFVGPGLHPGLFLKSLAARIENNSTWPELAFHIYDDITVQTPEWLQIENILKGRRLNFFATSERHRRIVEKIFMAKKQTALCPLAVDPAVFRFDSRLRAEGRRRLGLRPGDIGLIYVGRMSLQKNVVAMLERLVPLLSTKANLKLFAAGPFDDLGAPYFGIHDRLGSYFQNWNHRRSGLSGGVRSRVKYLGSRTSSEIAEFLNACDIFLSASLHHDENFGMGPCEALACGLPAVITDWAGYATFGGYSGCTAVPTALSRSGIQIDWPRFLNGVEKILRRLPSAEERGRLSLTAHRDFSIASVSRVLIDRFDGSPTPRFRGFSNFARTLALTHKNAVRFPGGPVRRGFYEKVYGSYATECI